MANHGFARFSKPIDPDAFEQALRAVAAERFPDCLDIMVQADGSLHWTIAWIRPRPMSDVSIWLHAGGRKLEWRHPADTGFSWWLQEYLVHATIARLGVSARITDEGTGREQIPNTYHMRFPTYSAWEDALVPGHLKTELAVLKTIFAASNSLPADIRAIVG